jgi:SanA protein
MRRILLIVGVALVALVGLSVLLRLPVEAVADHVYPSVAAAPGRAVVIVPGAGLYPDGTPRDLLAARLDCAIDAWRAGKATRILVSGDHGQATHDEPNAMRRYLLARGIPDAVVFMDHAGFRTRDTMERAARVFEVGSAIVCTQALHAPRSVFLALDAGIDAVAVVANGDAWLGFGQHLREHIAIDAAVLDAAVGTEPALLGDRIPIAGDSRLSHDRTDRANAGEAVADPRDRR